MSDRRENTVDGADSIRILYVDDEEEFAALAAEFLRREDDRFETVTESGAADALDRLDSASFDCVVSDYDMPGMDGLEFLAAARERRPGLPFVLVTGKGSEEIASEAISAGVTDYLQKSGGREQYTILANRIRNAVAQYRAEREAAHHRRVSELVRDVTRALVGATSRDEIEQAVCDRIADSNPYRFAWIGVDDGEDSGIEPRKSAGVEEGYLDGLTVTADDTPTGRGPAGAALREGTVSVAQDVREDASFAPWRSQAVDRGFRSAAGVPLSHDGTVYGVLVVYAAHADAFDDTERVLLRELGEAIGHAIDAIRIRERFERQYQSLFEDAPVMCAFTRDADGSPIVSSCNQRLLDRLGYDRETVVGSPLSELYTGASVSKLLDEGGYERALDGEFTREERQLLTADGETVETLLRAVPRYDAEGETVGTLTLFVDITDRRQAGRVVTQAEAMEASIDGMAIVGPDGTYDYLNDAHARLYGYDDADELLGESWRRLYGADERERFETEVMPELRRTGHWRGEAAGRRADGTTFPQEVSLTELNDEQFVCVVRDITERREAEREIERRNRRLDEFASVVSHDLRGPLGIARGNVELARTADGDATDRLDTADAALDRMDRIIDDVLSLARGTGGTDDTAVVSLERTVADCWQGNDGEVTVTADVRFVADRSRLQRLLENLFRNSVEHGSTSPRSQTHEDSVEHGSTGSRSRADDGSTNGGNGSVSGAGDRPGHERSNGRSQPVNAATNGTTTERRPDDVEIRVGPLADEPGFFVEDDGPGVPPDVREDVFDAGYSTSASGTGLGLAIVERIAEEHGWGCRLTTGRDGGARFEFAGVDLAGARATDTADRD